MRKNIISIILLLIATNLLAQTAITRSAISSVGYTNTIGNAKLLCTVGELVVRENTQGTVHISEGFINPELAEITGVSDYTADAINISIYPNPASDFVNIIFSNPNYYEIVLYSMQGEIIKTYIINNNIFKQIPLNKLTNGEYLLIVKNKTEKTYKTFKLIKQ